MWAGLCTWVYTTCMYTTPHRTEPNYWPNCSSNHRGTYTEPLPNSHRTYTGRWAYLHIHRTIPLLYWNMQYRTGTRTTPQQYRTVLNVLLLPTVHYHSTREWTCKFTKENEVIMVNGELTLLRTCTCRCTCTVYVRILTIIWPFFSCICMPVQLNLCTSTEGLQNLVEFLELWALGQD